MFKKTIAISFIFSLLFSTSAMSTLAAPADVGNDGGNTNDKGKTSLQVLVPTAEMRTPLVEVKDLDSCILGIISNTGNIIGGLMGEGDGGVDMGGALGTGCSWDSIAWFAAKVLIGIQFDEMKAMAQTGFFGNTSFVDNPQAYYSTINGEVTDYFFANDYNNSTLLDTIKGNVRAGILGNQNRPFTQSISTGTDFPGGEEGYQAYLADGTCQTGNYWDCYQALQSPKNDIFSVQMRTQAALTKVQNEALTHTQAEVQAGNGYRDIKQDCVYGHYIGCISVTPGSSVEVQTNAYLGESLKQLDSADELDEALAPAVTALYQVMVGWLGDMNLRDL